MENPDKPTKKRSLPLEDVIAPLVFIVVMAGAVVAWHRFAGAPFWLAAILGLPTGFIAVFGGVWLLSRFK
jgi:hypothetical protein